MTKAELIKEVQDALTASCALPYSPPDKEIDRIIDLEMRWLYREYRDSQFSLKKDFYACFREKTGSFRIPFPRCGNFRIVFICNTLWRKYNPECSRD